MEEHPEIRDEKRREVMALQRLKADAEKSLESLDRRDFDDSVNWGDLHVIQAEKVLLDDGGEMRRIIICEAAPNSTDLQMTVYEALKARGWHDIEVMTEW